MGNCNNTSQWDYDFDTARLAANSLIEKIDRDKKPLPVLSALIHVFKCAHQGVTMDTFKPLIRERTYVGVERREMRRGTTESP